MSALLVCTACEDPSIALQDQAAVQIRSGGAKIAQAAHRASLDRVAAAEDLRTAGAKLANILGSSDAQKQVAASLIANASTQAALLEIGKVDQIESANRSSRMLAKGLLQVVDDIHGIVGAQDTKGLAEEKNSFQPSLSTASRDQVEYASQQSTLTQKVSDLRSANESALGDAQTLLAEAEEIRVRGLSAQRGEITVLAVEAGRKRDEARTLQTQADEADVAAMTQESILRLQAGEALSAARRAKAFQGALDVLGQLSAGQTTIATQEIAISDALRASILALVTASNPDEDLELKGCYERAFADLETADTAARRSGPKSSSLFSIAAARARALLMRGEGEFQQALLFHALAMSPSMSGSEGGFKEKADSWLSKAQASTKDALAAYTTLQEVLASSGAESPSKQALVQTVERALKIQMPTFEVNAAQPVEAASKNENTDPSKDAPSADPAPKATSASTAPPFASAADLAAFFASSKRDPAVTAHINELLIATTPEGQSLAATAFGVSQAIGQLQLAMQKKFGSSDLGLPAAMNGQGATATVSDATEDAATIAIGNLMGSLSFKAARTEGGWKLDLDTTAAEMDETMRTQMTMVGAMMGTLTEGLTGITAQVESGKIKNAQDVQSALAMAMKKLMGGAGGGGPGDDNTPTEN